jgi:proteasome lid subunit RPN8/RPN11
MATLHLPAELRARIERWAAGGYPLETCGLLLGSRRDGDARVVEVASARNVNQMRARDRYELDPLDFLAADRAARNAGLDLVGVWHSHPDHPAEPSETDRIQAWEGWSYLIASVNVRGVQGLRSWRLAGGRFVEEVIEP